MSENETREKIERQLDQLHQANQVRLESIQTMIESGRHNSSDIADAFRMALNMHWADVKYIQDTIADAFKKAE